MGLLDGLTGMLGGKKKKQKSLISTGNPLIDALLPMLLGGGGAGMLGKLGGLGALAKMAGGKGGRGGSSGGLGALGGLLGGAGGLGGLLSQFQSAGLGTKAQSWVSTGANEAISPEEVEAGLGADAIDHLAQQTGMDRGAVTSQLTTVLPNLVNDLTPDGSVPDEGALAGLAQRLDLGRILGN